MRHKDPNKYVQTSFRIPPEIQTTIRRFSEEKQVTQSDILRSAVTLYSHVQKLEPGMKLAVVDTNDHDAQHRYLVKQWILTNNA